MRSPIARDWTSATNSSEPLPEDAWQPVSVEDQSTDRHWHDVARNGVEEVPDVDFVASEREHVVLSCPEESPDR